MTSRVALKWATRFKNVKTLIIDVVGSGIQSGAYPMSRVVKGQVQVETGDETLDLRVIEIYRNAGREAYLLLLKDPNER